VCAEGHAMASEAGTSKHAESAAEMQQIREAS
jgi:hypothetical protein